MVTRPRNLPQADPYFDSVVLLVPFSGEDGVTTSTDLSNSAHALTFNGTAALDSDIRKYGFTSLLLDGNSDYVTAAQDASFDFGSSDFTVEGWVRWDAIPGAVDKNNFLGFWDANGVNQRSWLFSLHDRNLRFLYSTNGTAVTQINRSWTPSADTWYHVAACRDSGTIRLFIDGVQQGADVSAASAFHSPTSLLYIGVASTGSGLTEYMNGWHEGWRITKGVARYTAAFTPPERAHPTVQNVDGIFELPDTSAITYDSISSSLSAAGYFVDFVWNDDGTQWIYTDDGNGGGATGYISYASCSTPYDVTTLSTSRTIIDTTTGRGRGIQWNNDGTKIYTSDFGSTNNFHSWNVSPAYDITSISLTPDATETVASSTSTLGFHITDDGKYVIFGQTSATLYLHEMSTPWDITTIDAGTSASFSASGATRCDQAIISNDGTRIWQLGANTEKIHQWTLSTPFDLSTASWDGSGKDFALQDSGSYVNVTGMTIHPTNRNELYVTWTLSSYRIQKYTF